VNELNEYVQKGRNIDGLNESSINQLDNLIGKVQETLSKFPNL
jgi:hypothetical protein